MPTWAIGIAAGLVLLNNSSSGWSPASRRPPRWPAALDEHSPRALLRLAGQLALGVGATIVAFTVFSLLRAGALPNVGRMLVYSRLYTSAGYSNFPLDGVVGLQLVIFATYVAAIGTATARAVAQAENRVLTALLVWVGIFGLGSASYYVVRSGAVILPQTFAMWSLALALLTIAALAQPRRLPGLATLALLFGIGTSATSIALLPTPAEQLGRMQAPPPGMAFRVDRSQLTAAIQPTRDPQVRDFVSSLADGPDRFATRRRRTDRAVRDAGAPHRRRVRRRRRRPLHGPRVDPHRRPARRLARRAARGGRQHGARPEERRVALPRGAVRTRLRAADAGRPAHRAARGEDPVARRARRRRSDEVGRHASPASGGLGGVAEARPVRAGRVPRDGLPPPASRPGDARQRRAARRPASCTSARTRERPWVVTNFATTADGRATIDGRSGPIGDDGDMEIFRRLRTQVDALLIGTRTLGDRALRARGQTARAARRPRGARARARAARRDRQPQRRAAARHPAVPGAGGATSSCSPRPDDARAATAPRA